MPSEFPLSMALPRFKRGGFCLGSRTSRISGWSSISLAGKISHQKTYPRKILQQSGLLILTKLLKHAKLLQNVCKCNDEYYEKLVLYA